MMLYLLDDPEQGLGQSTDQEAVPGGLHVEAMK